MPIDDCRHAFAELTRDVLPDHLAELRKSMARHVPVADFDVDGWGIAKLARQFDRTADFQGCYVFVEEGDAFYVGISRRVIERIREHVRGATHNDATLAYRMATGNRRHGMTRSGAMDNLAFKEQFAKSQERLRKMEVAFVEIPNALERHLFEAYCSMELDTGEWNTFETYDGLDQRLVPITDHTEDGQKPDHGRAQGCSGPPSRA